MNRDTHETTGLPPQLSPEVAGFRWTVAVIDFVLGLGFGYLGVILFFRRGSDFFSAVPDGVWGVLLGGCGLWVLYSGYRLVIEPLPVCRQNGKRRHLIAAALGVLMIAVMWLSLIGDSQDGFGPAVGVFFYTIVVSGVILFWLIAAFGMSRHAPKEPSGTRTRLFERLRDELKPPSDRHEH
jgi:hypothetical protein